MKIFQTVVAATAFLLTGTAVAAPHVHGVAELKIALEKNLAIIEFTSPLDNLVGFERAPRTPSEQQRFDAMKAQFQDGQNLWRFNSQAQCVLTKIQVQTHLPNTSAPQTPAGKTEVGQAKASDTKTELKKTDDADNDHAELNARYEFTCAHPPAAQLEVEVFAAFKRLKRIQVQAVTPSEQFQRELRRPEKVLVLKRQP